MKGIFLDRHTTASVTMTSGAENLTQDLTKIKLGSSYFRHETHCVTSDGLSWCTPIHLWASKVQSRHAPSLPPSLLLVHEVIVVRIEIISTSASEPQLKGPFLHGDLLPDTDSDSHHAGGQITLQTFGVQLHWFSGLDEEYTSEVHLPDLLTYQALIHVVVHKLDSFWVKLTQTACYQSRPTVGIEATGSD